MASFRNRLAITGKELTGDRYESAHASLGCISKYALQIGVGTFYRQRLKWYF